MDRDALDTFDLLDDIEKNLGIDTCPMNWPIGSGKGFRGVYERKSGEVIAERTYLIVYYGRGTRVEVVAVAQYGAGIFGYLHHPLPRVVDPLYVLS